MRKAQVPYILSDMYYRTKNDKLHLDLLKSIFLFVFFQTVRSSVRMRFNKSEVAALAAQPSDRFEKEGVLFVRERQEGFFRRTESKKAIFSVIVCKMCLNVRYMSVPYVGRLTNEISEMCSPSTPDKKASSSNKSEGSEKRRNRQSLICTGGRRSRGNRQQKVVVEANKEGDTAKTCGRALRRFLLRSHSSSPSPGDGFSSCVCLSLGCTLWDRSHYVTLIIYMQNTVLHYIL